MASLVSVSQNAHAMCCHTLATRDALTNVGQVSAGSITNNNCCVCVGNA